MNHLRGVYRAWRPSKVQKRRKNNKNQTPWGLPQPYILTLVTRHESLLCLSWSCEHFAHPISHLRKYFFTTFFCSNFRLWRPLQPEISKIKICHECVFWSHSFYLQNELFPKVIAWKKSLPSVRNQLHRAALFPNQESDWERNSSKRSEWGVASI